MLLLDLDVDFENERKTELQMSKRLNDSRRAELQVFGIMQLFQTSEYVWEFSIQEFTI